MKAEYAAYPKPKSALPLIAPNMHAEVQRTMDEHPEIDTSDEVARAEVIDITCWRVNGGYDRPWGRKARNNDPNNPNLNTDGMCYLRPDTLFEIYDCINGNPPYQATWDGYGPFAQGENGWWWPPQPVADQPPPTPPTADLESRVVTLEAQVAELLGDVSALTDQVMALTEAAKQPLRAHGPVDLPIVVESLTRMRAKGDIDVNVKPGEASPPPPSDEEFGLLDLALLKRILERDDAPARKG